MDLSVVICTHNRAALLGKTIRSLNEAAKPDSARAEIVIAANACSDGTLDLLREYQAQAAVRHWLPLRVYEESKLGKSHALNTVLAQPLAPLIAFVDDDHRVAPDYLVAIARASQDHPEAHLYCGKILPDWTGQEPEWVHDTGPYRITPLPVPRFDQGDAPRRLTPEIATPGGGNLVIRQELITRVGGFSATLGPKGHNLGGAEDLEWVRRALAGGAVLQYVPGIVQYHYVDADRLTMKYLVRKAYERAASVVIFSDLAAKTRSVPLFLYRKLINYAFAAACSFSANRRRFYIVRLAATLGEIKGFAQLERGRRSHAAKSGS